MWWAAKELQRGKKLQDYIGKNEKTKLVVKIQRVTAIFYFILIKYVVNTLHLFFLVEGPGGASEGAIDHRGTAKTNDVTLPQETRGAQGTRTKICLILSQ